ncbi:hypothetical protein AB0M44_47720 [Streptosporangium subroseum]|uniref:hypothetical protein n=1 Tax=Streptosporangium subroseum TaxID=106412 RepID=UPI00342B55D1
MRSWQARPADKPAYLSWLAVALADANESEEAAHTASRMLDLSADLPATAPPSVPAWS